MKTKTIRKVLNKKFNEFIESITDEALRLKVKKNSIITGGSITSMLMKEPVNDYDIYFRNFETALAVASYYVHRFNLEGGHALNVDSADGRIRVVTKSKHRGETKGDLSQITDSGEIEDTYEQENENALNTENEDGKPKYRPVFMSTNALTLSGKIQLIIRFYGEPEEIHANYDYVHCTNYWTSWENNLVLKMEALESILSKELRYVGSKYPLCSIMRLRKFIARGWTINAGQILKMVMQTNDLDLTDPKVLDDQLTGVDSAYFMELIVKLKDKDPEKINTAYLCKIIDRIF